MTIDDYVKIAENLPNSSDGGSPAFIIGDVVLVCYRIPNKYGIARPREESIREEVNKKADNGVNTPHHLEVKRTTNGENNYCWVLQERAPGKSFAKYCGNKDLKVQLQNQKEIADAPQEQYDKYVHDLIELFYFGLETKPKNLFYDKEKGFTIIDLLEDGKKEHFDYESIKDISYLFDLTRSLTQTAIPYYYIKDIPEEQKQLTDELRYVIEFKTYNAVKNNIPNFKKFERWILRSFDKDKLAKFKEYGLEFGNLVLTEEEQQEFNATIDKVVEMSLEKVACGKYLLWQIFANEIRNDLQSFLMYDSWMLNPDNIYPIENVPEGTDMSTYDYKYHCDKRLQDICKSLFTERLLTLAKDTENEFIKKAASELEPATPKFF